ncbi:MFS polyamine transporter [Crucibulum laeve]|uniref:MFS polyamine transporter n=1 Tax=Crucibulum laeve TaxID=68775 RepID=A0A5C3LHU2_9AGAR|nr:MFS polyamine transporter [Crucibulum laeve]
MSLFLHSETSTQQNTPRSSFTFTERPRIDYEKSHLNDLENSSPESHQTPLEEEISRDEQAFERYGGDDIHEPTPKSEPSPPTLPTDTNKVDWDGPDDPSNPQNWSIRYKWIITMVCIIMTVNVTFASSAPSTAALRIKSEFGISSEISYLITTVFLLGYVFGPLFWGPGSELVGRKPIFIITMVLYTLFHLGQALAQNIETLLITRFFSGFFAVAPLTNCGGVIADIWSAEGRGPAVSLFTASVFLGPVLGPIVSGFIVQKPGVDWRWVFWVMMIFAGVCTLIMIPLLPETYAPILLQKKARHLRKADPVGKKNIYAEHEKQDWSLKGIIHRTLFRPFQMLAMEPILVLITLYLSVVYGLLYALFQAFPIIFVRRRGFTVAEDGLMFIGIGIGTTIGSIINYFATAHYPQLIKKWKGFPPPEERLFGAMLGSPLLVIACFWLGWTGEYAAIPWYVPGLSTVALGISISLIFMSFLSYIVDTYLMFSASALAANTVIRSAVAAAFPLFTVQMFTNLGVNWASTLIGLLALLFAPSPFLFYKYGPSIRGRSKFAPCIVCPLCRRLRDLVLIIFHPGSQTRKSV